MRTKQKELHKQWKDKIEISQNHGVYGENCRHRLRVRHRDQLLIVVAGCLKPILLKRLFLRKAEF